MSEGRPPDEVVGFLAGYIGSALQLEILLLLQADPQKEWTATAIDEQLRVNPSWVGRQLEELCDRGLLKCVKVGTPTYRYGPVNEELGWVVAALAEWYATHRVSVISLIYGLEWDGGRDFVDKNFPTD